MEVDPPGALQQPYAILRIKRKRNEEPLDALVVDAAPSRKRTRSNLNVFQYAGTVEEAAWNDEQQKQQLEKRLAGLTRGVSHKQQNEVPASVPAARPPTSPVAPRSPKRRMIHAPSRTYTIVTNELEETPHIPRRSANAPPKVWSSKELEAAKRAAQFKMYDAVPSTTDSRKGAVPSEMDTEMEKFLPMLKDYLSVGELAPATFGDGAEDDYVYDVFYHRPATIQELYEPGLMSNIAKLTGLPPELSGLYGDDDSDEEYDDEDDEDSNAEDWYTNDYPDEESDREEDLSDEFHEHSDSEDVVHGYERDMGRYRDVMSHDF